MPKTRRAPPSLRELRERRILTQAELAERAGTTQPRIAMLETGRVGRPHPSTLRKLAAALDLDPADVRAAFEVSRNEAVP